MSKDTDFKIDKWNKRKKILLLTSPLLPLTGVSIWASIAFTKDTSSQNIAKQAKELNDKNKENILRKNETEIKIEEVNNSTENSNIDQSSSQNTSSVFRVKKSLPKIDNEDSLSSEDEELELESSTNNQKDINENKNENIDEKQKEEIKEESKENEEVVQDQNISSSDSSSSSTTSSPTNQKETSPQEAPVDKEPIDKEKDKNNDLGTNNQPTINKEVPNKEKDLENKDKEESEPKTDGKKDEVSNTDNQESSSSTTSDNDKVASNNKNGSDTAVTNKEVSSQPTNQPNTSTTSNNTTTDEATTNKNEVETQTDPQDSPTDNTVNKEEKQEEPKESKENKEEKELTPEQPTRSTDAENENTSSSTADSTNTDSSTNSDKKDEKESSELLNNNSSNTSSINEEKPDDTTTSDSKAKEDKIQDIKTKTTDWIKTNLISSFYLTTEDLDSKFKTDLETISKKIEEKLNLNNKTLEELKDEEQIKTEVEKIIKDNINLKRTSTTIDEKNYKNYVQISEVGKRNKKYESYERFKPNIVFNNKLDSKNYWYVDKQDSDVSLTFNVLDNKKSLFVKDLEIVVYDKNYPEYTNGEKLSEYFYVNITKMDGSVEKINLTPPTGTDSQFVGSGSWTWRHYYNRFRVNVSKDIKSFAIVFPKDLQPTYPSIYQIKINENPISNIEWKENNSISNNIDK